MPEIEPVFLDTNVVLYALGTEEPKRAIARALLQRTPILSSQVLSEATSVLSRKCGVARPEVTTAVDAVRALAARIVPVDEATVVRAWGLWEEEKLAWFDSLIVSAALTAGCSTLYAEDFQHGRIFGGRLTVVNPFLTVAASDPTG